MATQKITALEQVEARVNANVVITQPVNGKESVRRATLASIIKAIQTRGIIANGVEPGVIGTAALSDDVMQMIEDAAASGGLAFSSVEFEDGYLHLYDENGEDVVEPCYIGAGGGSSDYGSVIRIANRLPARSITITETAEECSILYTATSTDAEDGSPTGNLTAEWYINGTRRAVETIRQGDNSFNVRRYLNTGANNSIKVVITDSYGNSKSSTWTVTVTAYSVSWTLDELSNHNSDDLIVRLTVNGTGDKTVILKVDDTEYYNSVISTTGRTVNITIPAQEHGEHIITAWAEAELDGVTLKTNVLRHSGIWIESGKTAPVIATAADEYEAGQYATLNIKYMVYDPTCETTTVMLAEDNRVTATVTADRAVQEWNYKANKRGSIILKIIAGNTSKDISLTVSASEYDIAPITEGLVLDLDPAGHSNTEIDRASFGYTDAEGVNHPLIFSNNFDWTDGGFKTDADGVTALVIKRGTTVTFDKSFFADNAKTNGKEIKIVFKAVNCRNYDAEILSCRSGGIGVTLGAQSATLGSELAAATVQYCEERKIEMDINIDAASENKLAMVWLEGVPSRVFAYTDSDSWVQTTPQNIIVGSADCDVWIYRIKQYNVSLSRFDINNNFIADCSNPAEMIARYERNDIYNSDGTINITKLSAANPSLRVIRISAPRMTTSKEDEVTADIEMIYAAGGEEHHLTAHGATIKAQGTSSLEYILAALNLDVDFSTATDWTDGNGSPLTSYAMTNNSIPVSYFNVKLDVASSEKANNVVLAERYNRFQPFRTEERQADSRVRDTVEGHLCVVFFTSTASQAITVGARTVQPGETIMYGAGNLNNSKKNTAVFGQTSNRPLQCCIEIGNNNNPQCLFKTDDLTAEGWTGKNGSNFEFRYPKKGTQEMKDKFQEVLSWVVSTDTTEATNEPLEQIETIDGIIYTADTAAYRGAKFKSEVGNYFSVDSLLYHYLFTERHLMVDNRAKNTFISYEWDTAADGYRWNFTKDYDNDTADGNDNSGGLTFTYGMEDVDMVGASYVFNAHNSVLWSNVRDYLADELQAMYTNRESLGTWDAADILTEFENHQAACPETLAAEDMFAKYVSAYIYADEGRFLNMMLGTKADQRRQFEVYQELYIASKYKGARVTGTDKMTFRINKPEEWQGVRPSGNIVGLVPYADVYLRAKFGNAGEDCIRAKRGQMYTLTCPPSAELNDLETYLYGSSVISHIGSMAGLYTKFADVSAAVRIQEFLLGSEAAGYENTGITGNVSIGNNKLIEVMDLRGTPNLAVPLDLSGLTSLRELYATNSGVTGVTFAVGAPVEIARLGAIRRLVARNLTKLETFICDISELTTIWVENTPGIDTSSLAEQAEKLTRGRLTGVNWSLENADVLLKLKDLSGFDATGGETENFVLTGNCHIQMVSREELTELAAAFPELAITYDTLVETYTVTFKNYDGTTLNVQHVRQYGAAVNPVTAGMIETPTRDATVETVYTFTGWDTAFTYILRDTVVTAAYSETDRTYRVTWWRSAAASSPLYELTEVGAHAKAVYAGAAPEAASGGLWVGWSASTADVVSDMDIYAEFITPTLPDTVPETYDYLYSDDEADDSAYTLAEFYGIISSRKGKEYFNIGDKIKLVPDAGTTAFADSSIIFSLEAFNHFRYADDDESKEYHFAHTFFGAVGTLNATRQMHSSNTNVGGWPMTTLRSWLNGTFYNALPQKWKAMITKVQVISTEGNTKDTTVTSEDFITLRSWTEVGFGSGVPYGGEIDSGAESKAFSVYNSNNARIKRPYNNTGSAVTWWLRSPYASNTTSSAAVISDGTSSNATAMGSNGVSPGFSIG